MSIAIIPGNEKSEIQVVKLQFTDIFELNEIQRLQDFFADATGVASIITDTEGKPITKPSNFCRLCNEIIRKTDRGLANCMKSDAILGRNNQLGSIIQPCLSGGLWDAGTSITVGGNHIANWLIGQVRNEEQNEERMLSYAMEIGANPDDFILALREVPVMSKDQFQKVARMLNAFAIELSEKAFKNKQLERLVAERKHIDEQVAMLAFAMKSVSECVSITDMNDKVLFLNESFTSTYLYTEKELIGKSIQVVRSEKNCPEFVRQILPETKQGGWCGELINKRKDGTEFPIFLSTSIIHDDAGNPFAIIGVARDISSQKKAEKELGESLERFQKANQATFNVIWDWDLITNNIWWNDRFQTIFGYSQQEIEPGIASWTSRLHPDDAERVVKGIHAAIDSGEDYWYDQYRFGRKNGSWAILDDRGYIIRNTSGNAIRMIGAMQDITERFEFIDELEKAKEKAEAGDKLKTAFMHNISHEIRTPLNGILGFSSLMIQPGTTDDEKELYYPLIKASSERLLNTVNSYMDISMIASGNMEVRLKLLEVKSLLLSLHQKFLERCSGRRLKLGLVTPPSVSEVIMESDEEMIQKILTQLLDNAFKFTNTGEISFGYTTSHRTIDFFVRDTGVGINPDALIRIFENFAQEEVSDSKGHEGSGLGLSIAKGLVQLLGGSMHVESEKGAGSTFFVKIPLKQDLSLETGHTLVRRRGLISNKPVVLIAEDDESNMLYLHSILRKTEVTILSAMNGSEAVTCCRKHPEISLILMDMKMPVMDGMEATRAIKAFRSDLPVIAVTAFAMSGDEKKIMEAGCDDYLTKPVHQASLLHKLKEYGLQV